MFIDFREGERGWAVNIDVRGKHWLVPRHVPWLGLNSNPRYVPWPGVEALTFWCTGWCSNQLRHTSEGNFFPSIKTLRLEGKRTHTNWIQHKLGNSPKEIVIFFMQVIHFQFILLKDCLSALCKCVMVKLSNNGSLGEGKCTETLNWVASPEDVNWSI